MIDMLLYRLNKQHYIKTANMDQMSECMEMMANLASNLRFWKISRIGELQLEPLI